MAVLVRSTALADFLDRDPADRMILATALGAGAPPATGASWTTSATPSPIEPPPAGRPPARDGGGRAVAVLRGLRKRRGGGPRSPRDPDPDAILVVLNARSGRGGGRREAQARVEQACEAAGLAVEIARTGRGRSPEDLAREGVERGYQRVVAAGGDGTICAVASALAGTDRTMGVLPLGTFNYFARSLGLPQDLDGAVEVLRAGEPRPVSVARVNGRAFLNNASLGAYAAILETREDVYRRWGRSRVAAYWSVVKALATLRGPLRLTIEAGGETLARRTPLAFAVANAYQLDELGLPGRDCIEAGGLALFVAPDGGRWGLMRGALALALGLARPERDYELICGAPIRIASRRSGRLVARDGERSRMRGPFELTVETDALRVIAPREKPAG